MVGNSIYFEAALIGRAMRSRFIIKWASIVLLIVLLILIVILFMTPAMIAHAQRSTSTKSASSGGNAIWFKGAIN